MMTENGNWELVKRRREKIKAIYIFIDIDTPWFVIVK